MTTACAWLLWVWEKAKKSFGKDQSYTLKALLAFIAIGPFWMLLLPAIENNAPITTQILMFPAMMQTVGDPCDSKSIAEFINNHYSKNTLLMAPSWISSRILYQTDIRIDFVANYPSHDKFIDNYAFFNSASSDTSREIARRHNIDLVLVCVNSRAYTGYAYYGGAMPFSVQMERGKIPDWLKRVPVDVPTNFILYAVDKTSLAKATP